MGPLLAPFIRQIVIGLLLSYAGKVAHIFLLWLTKKLLLGLKWASKHTHMKLDDELVEILEKALELQAQEPGPSGPPT